MDDPTAVLHERRGRALWITINRPDRRNAINGDVVEGIRAGIEAARADPQVRAVVLTGAGDKAFCAGADLKPGRSFERDHSQPTGGYADLLRLAKASTLPLVARLNGTCMAGGMGLLSMCDMAVAGDHVKFGLPEVKVGIFPMQVLSVLQHRVPRAKLAEWCLTGEPFDCAQALAAGLINYAVPSAELDAKVDWLVGRLVDKSPTAVRRGKFAMNVVSSMSFEQAIAYTESQIATLSMTEDAAEGRAAFNEKRAPNWTGR
jgi:enoyl-CoA hydratase/carnithine racemase